MGLITALFARAEKIDGARIIRVVVALALLLYALGFLTKPNVGIVGFIVATFGISGQALALAFSFCAGALMFNARISPLSFTLLTTPLALFAMAALAAWLLADPVGTPTAVASHFGFWLVVNIFNWLEVVAYERH